jgi:hypothetical protein
METNNISFFFEDVNLESDNSLEIEELMQKFNNESSEPSESDDLIDINASNMIYFITKNFYCGDNELYYNEEYKLKDLIKICKYYGILGSMKGYKCKKQDIVSTIVYFENCSENYEIVEKRHKMWAYMTELLEDPKMKGYLLF